MNPDVPESDETDADGAADDSVEPVRLEDAIEAAFDYLGKVAKYMKADVFALEETEYDQKSRLYLLTISLRRPMPPKKKLPIFAEVKQLLAESAQGVEYEYILKTVEVDEVSGAVRRIRIA